MPLGKNLKSNFKELYADNKKSGKAKGAGGKARPRAQIVAIALNAAGLSRTKKKANSRKAVAKYRSK